MHKKRVFITLIFAFWFLVIGVFIFSKQTIINMGQTVLIPVEPVDPRDIFRGDYVNLNYNISRIDSDLALPGEIGFNAGDAVYVLVAVQGDIGSFL